MITIYGYVRVFKAEDNRSESMRATLTAWRDAARDRGLEPVPGRGPHYDIHDQALVEGQPLIADDGGPGAFVVKVVGDVLQASVLAPVPVERPNGKEYRPRKGPVAVLTYDSEESVEGCIVDRTHNVELARVLTLAQLDGYDNSFPWELTEPRLMWGKWRPDRYYGRVYEDDLTGATGAPSIYFRAHQP